MRRRRCKHDILVETLNTVNTRPRTLHELYRRLGLKYKVLEDHIRDMFRWGWLRLYKHRTTSKTYVGITKNGQEILALFEAMAETFTEIQARYHRPKGRLW